MSLSQRSSACSEAVSERLGQGGMGPGWGLVQQRTDSSLLCVNLSSPPRAEADVRSALWPTLPEGPARGEQGAQCVLPDFSPRGCLPTAGGKQKSPVSSWPCSVLRSCFGTYFIKEVRILREKRRMCQCVSNTVYANEPVKYFAGSCQRSKVTLPGQQLFCLNRQAGLQEMSYSNLNSCVKVSN